MENNTTVTTEKKSDLKIVVTDHAAFDGTAITKVTNTEKLAELINDLFKPYFADFLGSSLDVQYQQDLHCNIIVPKIYFKVLSDDDYKANTTAFKTLGSETANTMIGRVQRVSQSAISGAKVIMTEDAKSALSDFMLNQQAVKSGKFDWTTCFKVIPSDTGSCVAVFKLDIIAILNAIFGDTDEAGNKLAYQIAPTYPLLTNTYKTGERWALNILQLNTGNQKSAAEDVGLFMPNSTYSNMPNIVTVNRQ